MARVVEIKMTPEIESKIKEIVESHLRENYVTREDFRELKGIVKELANAQKRTEERLEELAEAQKKTEKRIDTLAQKVEELAEAQKKTEKRVDTLAQKVEELAEAQKNTEKRVDTLAQKVEELTEAQKNTEEEVRNLAIGLGETRSQLGGLERSVSYSLENEAFRHLPDILKEKYGIELKKRLIRTEIKNKEFNIFGIGKRNGKEVVVIGETKLRLDERRIKEGRDIFKDLEEKVRIIKKEYKGKEIFKLLITHFARKKFIKEAKKQGVVIIQSFEW